MLDPEINRKCSGPSDGYMLEAARIRAHAATSGYMYMRLQAATRIRACSRM